MWSRTFDRICGFWVILAFSPLCCLGQDKWELRKNTDGIRVYTHCSNTKLKRLKADFTVRCTPQELAATLLDLNGYNQWVYSTKKTQLLKQISPKQVLYYTEKSMPWPMSNRDAVIQLTVEEPDSAGVVTAHLNTVAGTVPVHKDIVRIPQLRTWWRAVPQPGNTTYITYEAEVDPGGSVPGWILNLFSTKGPYETFKKLREVLERP